MESVCLFQVYDINNDTLLVASGTQLPDKVRSFFNHLKLVFISDSSEQFTGFRLKYIFGLYFNDHKCLSWKHVEYFYSLGKKKEKKTLFR